MIRGTGHVPDPAAYVLIGHVTSMLVGGGKTTRNENEDLLEHVALGYSSSARVNGIRDQAGSEQCVGQWLARAVDVFRRERGIVRPYPSPQGAWTLARCVDRGDPQRPLRNVGVRVLSAVNASVKFGLANEVDWPMPTAYFGKNADGIVDPEPTPEQVREAAGHPVLEVRRADTPSSIRATIDAGMAVGRAFDIDAKFSDYDGKTALGPPEEKDVVGGHMMTIAGYRRGANGRFTYLVVNSWGPYWGDRGMALVDEDWITSPRSSEGYALTELALEAA